MGAAVRAVPNMRVSASTPWDAVVQGYLGLSDRRVAAGLRTARPGKAPTLRPGWPGRWRQSSSGRRGPGVLPQEVIDGGLRKGALRARCGPSSSS